MLGLPQEQAGMYLCWAIVSTILAELDAAGWVTARELVVAP